MRDVPDLAGAVQDKYLLRDTFETYEHQVAGRDALLVTGLVVTEKVTWADRIYDLVGQTLPLGNQTAIGVLLIRSDNDGAWALCYGLGFQILDQSKVDPGTAEGLVDSKTA